MSTLTLDDVKQAGTIFERLFDTFRLRVEFISFKLSRSPQMRMFKSVRNYENTLQTVFKSDMLSDLYDDFTCVELGGELREKALSNRKFIAHCKRLLDGSHDIFQFAQLLSTPIGVDDVKLVKVVAEKMVDEITQWKQQAIDMARTDVWSFDFCLADIRCVIEKCQVLIDVDANVGSVVVAQPLLQEWWELIEKQHAIARTLHQ